MAHVEVVLDIRPHLTRGGFISGLYVESPTREVYITSHFKNEKILVNLDTGEAVSFDDTSYKFYPLSHGSQLEVKV